jgi:DNA-binding NarL/FixJ family response regulator
MIRRVLRVAVVDPLPLFRAGVTAVLSVVDCAVEDPDDLLVWADGGEPAVVVLTLQSEPDWSRLTDLAARSGRPAIIALVSVDEPAVGTRALRAGADAVLPRDAVPDSLRLAVQAAAAGLSVVPLGVIKALRDAIPAEARPGEGSGPVPRLTDDQLRWLRELAAGSTVSDLARRSGYSERAMYRLLQGVYDTMGVRGRTQALIQAQALGWFGGRA